MLERAALLPYVYTHARNYFETGVAFMRPLYYDYPLEHLAYEVLTLSGKFAQYSWGDDIIVAPIVSPLDFNTHLVEDKYIWVPPGRKK
jgi:alpha-glucosidase